MDLIYKRYANPREFINTLIKNKCFANGITTLLEEVENQRKWELFCSSVTARLIAGDERSFDDWKSGKNPKEHKSLSNDEIIKAKNKSNEILKSISPKMKGGKIT